MIRQIAAFTTAACLFAGTPLWADGAEDIQELSKALGLPEIIQIMREEGLGHGADVADQMFPGQGGESWRQAVSRIYDADEMLGSVEARLIEGLESEDVGPLLEFFQSERGERIIEFEVTARRALMDDDVEAAAQDAYAVMESEGDARLELIREFVEANDLVASNVMGAMNSNYAFFEGLAEGDALPSSMTEGDILSEVWSQEDEIRAETETWVYSYLAMAYQPLSDEDLEAYIAISKTEEGQALNRALFDGFDVMYNDISRKMGKAAAEAMSGQDI